MKVKDLDIVAMGAIAGVCGWIIGMLTSGYSNRAETGQSESQFTYVRGVGIYTVTHDGHRWVVSNQGGIVHHPDCQCNRFKQRTQKLKLV